MRVVAVMVTMLAMPLVFAMTFMACVAFMSRVFGVGRVVYMFLMFLVFCVRGVRCVFAVIVFLVTCGSVLVARVFGMSLMFGIMRVLFVHGEFLSDHRRWMDGRWTMVHRPSSIVYHPETALSARSRRSRASRATAFNSSF